MMRDDYYKGLGGVRYRLTGLANELITISQHVSEADVFFRRFFSVREFSRYFSRHAVGTPMSSSSAKDASTALKAIAAELFRVIALINSITKKRDYHPEACLSLAQRLDEVNRRYFLPAITLLQAFSSGFDSISYLNKQLEEQKKELVTSRRRVMMRMWSAKDAKEKEASLAELENKRALVESALKELKKNRKTFEKIHSRLSQDKDLLSTHSHEQLNKAISTLRHLAKWY